MQLRVSKLTDTAKLPTKAHNEDAGYDLYADEGWKFLRHQTKDISTGLSIEIPDGYGGFILPRSGLALKKDLTVLNAPGLIDPGYTGEVKVILHNSSCLLNREIRPGDRIAQLVVQKVESLELLEVDSIESSSSRGEGGFGSTGFSDRLSGLVDEEKEYLKG